MGPRRHDVHAIGALLIIVAIQAAAIVVLLIRARRRTRAEQARREREEQFRLTMDRLPAMIWTAGPNAALDYLNGTCAEFSGIPMEKLRGSGWLEAVHPEDLDPALEHLRLGVPGAPAMEPGVPAAQS